jgi:hypothetical protein
VRARIRFAAVVAAAAGALSEFTLASLSWNSSSGSGDCLHNGPMSGWQFVRPDRIDTQVLERAGCGINPPRSRR